MKWNKMFGLPLLNAFCIFQVHLGPFFLFLTSHSPQVYQQISSLSPPLLSAASFALRLLHLLNLFEMDWKIKGVSRTRTYMHNWKNTTYAEMAKAWDHTAKFFKRPWLLINVQLEVLKFVYWNWRNIKNKPILRRIINFLPFWLCSFFRNPFRFSLVFSIILLPFWLWNFCITLFGNFLPPWNFFFCFHGIPSRSLHSTFKKIKRRNIIS